MAGLFAAAALLGLAVLIDGWSAIGSGPTGTRQRAMEASPQWAGEAFENPEPLWNDWWGSLTGFMDGSDYASPAEPVPVQHTNPEIFNSPPSSGLRVTWLGHSTAILEIDGTTLLVDPVFGERTAPVRWLGPKRWYPPPIALDELPHVDAVLISHDHYDHLDYPTFQKLKDWDTKFIAPLGVTAHLDYWGVPPEHIVEVDWWDEHRIGNLRVVATPARHASGRQVLDQNRTLWAGYALIGPQHRVFFSGDTGLFRGMREIGERLGPFDLTMLEVGAYNRAWPDWHLGPEQAVRAQGLLQGRLLLPIHWGLFDLALHGWTEPIERTLAAAQAAGVDVIAPRPGESIEPLTTARPSRWWPDVPWETAEEHPIRATNVD